MNLRLLIMMLLLLGSSEVMAMSGYERARADVLANRDESALRILRSEVKARPDDYRAWFLIGVASAHLKRYHQAIEAFRHVIDIEPTLSEPHDNLAVIYNELDDVKAAVVELETSLKKNPANPVAEENLADLYLKLALSNYYSALARAPSEQLKKRYMRLLQVRGAPEADASAVGLTQGMEQAEQLKSQPAQSEPVKVEKEVEVAQQGSVERDAAVDSKAASQASEGQLVESAKHAVLQAVEMWRSAWSARDLENYFAAYSTDFEVPQRFSTAAEWHAYKKRVIASKRYIKIELSDIQVKMGQDDQVATVIFFQKFRSDSYNGDHSKQLLMRLEHGKWKIVKEE